MPFDTHKDPKDVDVKDVKEVALDIDLTLKKEDVRKDVDVDVKKDVEVDIKKDVDVDVDIKKDVDVEVDVKKDVDVDVNKDVDIDVNKDVDITVDIEKKEEIKKTEEIDIKKTEEIDIKKTEEIDIRKDEDIEIVKKDVDVNVWKVEVDVKAENIIDGTDNDVNDVDNAKLIDVGPAAIVKMDDFAMRNLANGKSFNGDGNDSQYAVSQTNELKDNDKLIAPSVVFWGVESSKGHEWSRSDDDDKPFQKVEVDGGDASTGDGIHGDTSANANSGDGSVFGDALASADNIVTTELLTQKIEMGGNQQGNFAKADVVGGDRVEANDINGRMKKDDDKKDGDHKDDDKKDEAKKDDDHKGDGHHGDDHKGDDGLAMRDTDNDVNDLDSQSLINVSELSALTMDDFNLSNVLNGESFNGPGNDMQFDVVQVNDMVDNDFLYNPQVKYVGPAGGTFQDIYVDGGRAEAGNGIDGNTDAKNNGLDGTVAGSATASADNLVKTEFLTQNIVMGANLQMNDAAVHVVGGDSITADNIDFTS